MDVPEIQTHLFVAVLAIKETEVRADETVQLLLEGVCDEGVQKGCFTAFLVSQKDDF